MEKDKYGFITLETGEKRGIYTVVKLSKKTKSGRYWVCKCECGIEKEISSSNFLRESGTTKCIFCGKGSKKSHNNKSFKEISGLYWSHLKSSAKQRSIEFNITIEEAWDLFIKQNKRCKLSNLEINMGFWDVLKSGRNKFIKGTASLDRIDSSRPYSKSNCQWVHKDVNWIKNNLNQEYFIHLCNLISKNMEKTNAS